MKVIISTGVMADDKPIICVEGNTDFVDESPKAIAKAYNEARKELENKEED